MARSAEQCVEGRLPGVGGPASTTSAPSRNRSRGRRGQAGIDLDRHVAEMRRDARRRDAPVVLFGKSMS
jgi:hypothetical protein